MGAFDSSQDFAGGLLATATKMAQGLAFSLPELIAGSDPKSL